MRESAGKPTLRAPFRCRLVPEWLFGNRTVFFSTGISGIVVVVAVSSAPESAGLVCVAISASTGATSGDAGRSCGNDELTARSRPTGGDEGASRMTTCFCLPLAPGVKRRGPSSACSCAVALEVVAGRVASDLDLVLAPTASTRTSAECFPADSRASCGMEWMNQANMGREISTGVRNGGSSKYGVGVQISIGSVSELERGT